MKKRNTIRQKSGEATSFQVRKWFDRFTRIQILGAVTVFAGIVLGILLLRNDETPTDDKSVARSNGQPQQRRAAEPAAANIDKTVTQGANRPPVVNAVMLSPNVVLPGMSVHVEVKASDPDQDDIRLDYTWKINGQIVEDQKEENFDTTGTRKGDLITVTVTPDDGKEPGKALDSNGIIIQNRPPEITSMPSAGVSSGFFQYQVVAQDPDNDPLQFSLEGAPSGMTIDPAGLIQWDVPQGLQGKQQVRVIVSDGSASSFQSFNLNLGQ